MKISTENWIDIPDYIGHYRISDQGRVKSIKRVDKSVILKPQPNTQGYLHVSLSINGDIKTWKIHQLMAIAFLDHKPNGMGMVVDHIDNDRTNNVLSNLQIISQRDNINKDMDNEFTGAYYEKKSGRWQSRITIDGKDTFLGMFETQQEAHLRYKLELSNHHLNQKKQQLKEVVDHVKYLLENSEFTIRTIKGNLGTMDSRIWRDKAVKLTQLNPEQ